MSLSVAEKTALQASAATLSGQIDALTIDPPVNPLQAPLDAALAALATANAALASSNALVAALQTKISNAQAALA